MQAGYHFYGGAGLNKKMKMGAAIVAPGIIVIGGAGSNVGVIPVIATNFADAFGLALDLATYSTVQAAVEGIVTVDVRPDLVIRALMSGAAGEGTALTTLTNTSASAGGTTCTAAGFSANDMDGGMLWGLSGNNVGQSRSITTFTASTSAVVVVPFPQAIAVNDTMLHCPFNVAGTGAAGADGPAWLTTTTLFTQANADAAAAAGGEAYITDLELNGATDSYVSFMLRLHAYRSVTLAS